MFSKNHTFLVKGECHIEDTIDVLKVLKIIVQRLILECHLQKLHLTQTRHFICVSNHCLKKWQHVFFPLFFSFVCYCFQGPLHLVLRTRF